MKSTKISTQHRGPIAPKLSLGYKYQRKWGFFQLKCRKSVKLSGKLPRLFDLLYQVTKLDRRDETLRRPTAGIRFTDGYQYGGAWPPGPSLATPLR